MKRKLFVSLLTACIGLSSCNTQLGRFDSVDVQKFAKVIGKKNVVRLDVRTPQEYAEGHIDGAINIDVQNDNFEQKAITNLPKKKTVALYCRSGRRSKKAADILSGKGYKVVELNSGYNGWVKEKK